MNHSHTIRHLSLFSFITLLMINLACQPTQSLSEASDNGSASASTIPTNTANSNLSSNNDAIATNQALQVQPDDIIGIWKPQNMDLRFEIFKNKDLDEYQGKVVWLKKPNGKDGKPILDRLNPQKKLRQKPVMGAMVIQGFEFNSLDDIWEEGLLYDPATGQTFKGTLKMLDKDTMKFIGFEGFSLTETETTWKRVTE